MRSLRGRCSAADAECLRELRESKKYKLLGLTWEECCKQRAGIGRSTADQIIQKFAARAFGLYPQITTGWVQTFLQDWAYSCAKAERELGYTYTPLKEGIRLTYAWLLHQRQPSRGPS